MTKGFAIFQRMSLLPALAAWGFASSLRVVAFAPYDPDAETLHLWHLDEAGPPFSNTASSGVALHGLHNGAKAGVESLPGMGKAVSFNANAGGTPGFSDLRGAVLTAGEVISQGPGDNAPAGFSYFGNDGAFTFELLVKLDVMPFQAGAIAMGLMTMEGDAADRIFNFRIEKEGFLTFIPLPHSGAMGGGVATIPTSGPHAVDTKSWFHVAVAYDGDSGATNNLKLYWTRLDSGALAANCIGSGSLSNDFNGNTGDFALGNEARNFPGNAEAEPFAGLIDEVRISSVARKPTDFIFVPKEQRGGASDAEQDPPQSTIPPDFDLALLGVFVDSKKIPSPDRMNDFLELKSGLHRLDFDFGFNPDHANGNVKLRCLLEGVDERWRETELGMTLVFQSLDGNGRVLSQSRFNAVGRSDGWETSLEESVMTRRSEPVFVPAGARKIHISLASGPPDTTGFFAIGDISLHAPGAVDQPIWRSGGYVYDAVTTSPAGSLPGWTRGGADPAIARLIIRPDHPVLGLVDGSQSLDGEWFTTGEIATTSGKGGTLVLSWDEVFNVIDGDTRRATYVNVPPGSYVFRAMGLAGAGENSADSFSLSVLIHPPIWERFWFWPVISAVLVAMASGAILAVNRQRAKRSLERLRFQNALEKDRIRIARDMHDDLGTRVTFINLSASLASREIDRSPENARRHLAKMTESARELVVAMDDLVWAVDPSNDTLDDLASHLTRLADEMFRESRIRCRIDIPSLLPSLPLGAELRHHVALAVKEALHNVLRHAGPCEMFLSLEFNGEQLRITIRDTGKGFDLADDPHGHGLGNLAARFNEIGGTCKIESSIGGGTLIVLSCPVSKVPQ